MLKKDTYKLCIVSGFFNLALNYKHSLIKTKKKQQITIFNKKYYELPTTKLYHSF